MPSQLAKFLTFNECTETEKWRRIYHVPVAAAGQLETGSDAVSSLLPSLYCRLSTAVALVCDVH